MLTPDDIRDGRRASGFRHVRKIGGQPSRGASVTYYQAEATTNGERWHGRGRRTAEEAAWDYCLAVANGYVKRPQRRLKSAGHKRPQRPQQSLPDEVQAALGVLRDHRAQRAGVQGYVYCVTERGSGEYVKIGYSTNPPKRVAELQTGNPRVLVLLGTLKGTEADERVLHEKYAHDNILQEWFRPSVALLSEFNIPCGDAAGKSTKEDKAA